MYRAIQFQAPPSQRREWSCRLTDRIYRGGIIPTAPTTSRAPPPAARSGTRTPISAGMRSVSTASSAQMNELKAQFSGLQAHCESLEKERDFYFDSGFCLDQESSASCEGMVAYARWDE